MNLSKNRISSLKGFIKGDLIDSKPLYIITFSILTGYLLSTVVACVIASKLEGSSSSNSGSLTVGFVTAAICMFIYAIMMAVGKPRKAVFIFPIDRKTYTIGNLIMFAINSAMLLLIGLLSFFVEVALLKILTLFYDNILYINNITVGSIIEGFLISLLYIVFLATLTFLIFTLISRFKLVSLVSLALIIVLAFVFPFVRELLLRILTFYIDENQSCLLSLKLGVFALFFQFLSYMTLRNKEVNK